VVDKNANSKNKYLQKNSKNQPSPTLVQLKKQAMPDQSNQERKF
jgi:hypothetical protein